MDLYVRASWNVSRSVQKKVTEHYRLVFYGCPLAGWTCGSAKPPSALHAYAFDCVTHHLFHPYGTNSLQVKQDEDILREVAFDDSLQSKQDPIALYSWSPDRRL